MGMLLTENKQCGSVSLREGCVVYEATAGHRDSNPQSGSPLVGGPLVSLLNLIISFYKTNGNLLDELGCKILIYEIYI